VLLRPVGGGIREGDCVYVAKSEREGKKERERDELTKVQREEDRRRGGYTDRKRTREKERLLEKCVEVPETAFNKAVGRHLFEPHLHQDVLELLSYLHFLAM
jgi:FMN phosphatase YigB (HAD superfamily)